MRMQRKHWLIAGLLSFALAWGVLFGQPSAPTQTWQAPPAPAVADPGGHGGGG